MNFLLSYNWLKEFAALKITPENFAREFSRQAFSVERIHEMSRGLENVVVGKIVHIKAHPNADKLRIAITDVGPHKLEIVCGGVNLAVGMRVAAAQVGARVRWHGEGALTELAPAEIRGVKSEGMICGANELSVGGKSLFEVFPHLEKEILDLSWIQAAPGTPLAIALGLDDVVFDLEITSNRPDGMSVMGLAREAAAIFGVKFNDKNFTAGAGVSRPADHSVRGRRSGYPEPARQFTVEVQDKKLCGRYLGAMIENVTVQESSWLIKRRLWLAGVRPINNIVDITNYVMLETGQPMHAFDADKVSLSKAPHLNPRIIVRRARATETIKALDGKNYTLGNEMLVIADAKNPIAIAGIMGGEETGVTWDTKRIIFEAATFDPVSVRRTARALNLYSDSQLRFEKGLSTEAPPVAMARAVALAGELETADAGVSRIRDRFVRDRGTGHPEPARSIITAMRDIRARPYKPAVFPLVWSDIPTAIGIDEKKWKPAQSKKVLAALGFKIKGSGNRVKVLAPWWRDSDIGSSRDFVEEVARLYGYYNLPSRLPSGEIPPRPTGSALTFEDDIRRALAAYGWDEIFTYSLISKGALAAVGFVPEQAFKLLNPLTADLEYLRPSLIPSALLVVKENEKNFPTRFVFEVSNIYKMLGAGDLPREESWVIGCVWDASTADSASAVGADVSRAENGALFRQAKGALEALLKKIGVVYHFERYQGHDLWHPGRTLSIESDRDHLGTLGELHPDITERFGIEGRVAIFNFSVTAALRARLQIPAYEPPPPYPPVKRDIAFIVGERYEYSRLADFIRGFDPLISEVMLFDVYRGRNVGDGKKSLAFHLVYSSPERTLKAEEVDIVHKNLEAALQAQFAAELR
ncbi:MAG: phenylalanyl-tRNA synthetase, beta subunit [Candidatus Magasanikbacteria bacterium]|nr:phenylalanyl-tRNA synthetase, beta subunit [Candidatus Magasanikbacteria bacterium]